MPLKTKKLKLIYVNLELHFWQNFVSKFVQLTIVECCLCQWQQNKDDFSAKDFYKGSQSK